jgi:transposase
MGTEVIVKRVVDEEAGGMPLERTRRHYSDSFKREAVRTLVESGKPVMAVARLIGIDKSNLQKWRKIYGQNVLPEVPGTPCKSVGIEEFTALRKELETMKDTVDRLRDIVKKSLAGKYLGKDGSSINYL